MQGEFPRNQPQPVFLALIVLLSWVLGACGASPSAPPRTIATPAEPIVQTRRSRGTYSMQVTGVGSDRPFLVNTAQSATWARPRMRNLLLEHEVFLKGKEARYHFHVEFTELKRLTGTLSAQCAAELYLYARWPGDLVADNQLRQKRGLKKKTGPRAEVGINEHFSLRVRAKNKNEGGSILRKATTACADAAANMMLVIAGVKD